MKKDESNKNKGVDESASGVENDLQELGSSSITF
jgi:hypothetical protein